MSLELERSTKILKRIYKDKLHYEKEAVAQTEKIAKMKEQNADIHDIRKQKEVLQETENMIPDAKKRLATAWTTLSNLLEGIDKDNQKLKDTEEYRAARELLNETKSD